MAYPKPHCFQLRFAEFPFETTYECTLCHPVFQTQVSLFYCRRCMCVHHYVTLGSQGAEQVLCANEPTGRNTRSMFPFYQNIPNVAIPRINPYYQYFQQYYPGSIMSSNRFMIPGNLRVLY